MIMEGLSFRWATEDDAPLILTFIKELAAYEEMSEQVEATEETVREWLFERGVARAIFAVEDGEEIGYALFFHNFSTFTGRGGLHVEDLYVRPAHRGKGYGRAILKELARVALDEGCAQMELECLDWNRPSIAFYLSLGMEAKSEWTSYRLKGGALEALARA